MRHIPSDLSGRHILITGGGGFIGSNIALYLQQHHPQAKVTVFDKFRTGEIFPSGNPVALGHADNVKEFKGEILHGDITDAGQMQKVFETKFDIIFHQAAISDTTVEDKDRMFRTNVYAFQNILHFALQQNAKVIYASSAGTYGNSAPPNMVGKGEEPTNIYGESKLAMDKVAMDFTAKNPSMQVVGLRYFNVFGPHEFHKGKTASMILQLGLQVLKHKKVRLFKFGEQKRDFVYVDDVVQANIKAIESKKSAILNVGTGVSRTFNDIIEALKQEFGDFAVEYFDNPYAFYQQHTQADISTTMENLGYVPAFTLEEGIHKYASAIRHIHKHVS